jgi:hypothetical protein
MRCDHVVRATRSNTEQQTTTWSDKKMSRILIVKAQSTFYAAHSYNKEISSSHLLNVWFVAFVAPVFGVLQFLEFLCFQNIFQKLEQHEQHFFLTIIYAVDYKINKD